MKSQLYKKKKNSHKILDIQLQLQWQPVWPKITQDTFDFHWMDNKALFLYLLLCFI